MSLENCGRCGRLYAKSFRDVCNVCVKEIEQEYERCAEYLRQNRGAIITEVSEQTEVSIKQITKFIREGRISLMDAPNLGYPCEMCGTFVRENHICANCRAKLTRDIEKMNNQANDKANKSGTGHIAYQINEPEKER